MTDRFEQEAYAPGEYERLQAAFDKEVVDLASAILDENGGDVAKAMRVLAVKYLTMRHAWKQAKALQSETREIPTDAEIIRALRYAKASDSQWRELTREVGPYSITEPRSFVREFVRHLLGEKS